MRTHSTTRTGQVSRSIAFAPQIALLSALFLSSGCGDGGAPEENVCGDADEGEVGPNNEIPMAQIVAFDKVLRGCIDAPLDRDTYLFTTPAKPAGGYLTFELANMGAQEIRATLYVAAGQGQFKLINSEPGKPLTGYAALVAGLTYAVRVSHGGPSFEKIYQYELKLTWKEVPDGNEPNDFQGKPKSISANKTIKARMFAGYRQTAIPSPSVGAPDTAAYDDFYKVTLKEAAVTVQLADVPANVAMRAELTGPDGQEILCASGCVTGQGEGASLTGQASAGVYLLKVTRHPTPPLEPAGAGPPPENFTKDYLLKVAQ